MKSKTKISLIVFICFICFICFAIIVIMASCGGNDGKNNEGDVTSENPAQENEKEKTGGESDSMPDFPHEIQTFGGLAFTVLVEDEPWNFLEITDFDMEEEPGDVLNTAIYRRNQIVEEKLEIKLKGVHQGRDKIRGVLTKSIKAGSNDYAAAAMRLENASPAAMAGECVNLNGLESLSLDMPWWDQNILKDISVSGQSYLIAGDIFTKHYDAIAMLFFNKKLLSDYAVENPYLLVKSNQWTINKFGELTKNIKKDLDGDGVITHKDMFGFSTQADFLTSMINGCGVKFAEKDGNDIPYFTGGSEKMDAIINKVLDIYVNDSFCCLRDAYDKKIDFDGMHQFMVFPEGRSLFFWGMARFIEIGLRGMEDDFGILPIPKYDSAQDRYYSTASNGWHSYAWLIPQSSQDPDSTAYIMDTMAYYGRIHILPAYYDVVLTRKYTRDDESSAMLDIIFNSTVYDLGDLYNIGGFRGALENMIRSKNANNMASELEKAQNKIEKDLDKLITQFESNAN